MCYTLYKHTLKHCTCSLVLESTADVCAALSGGHAYGLFFSLPTISLTPVVLSKPHICFFCVSFSS